MIEKEENKLAQIIVDTAYHIHVATGPGLLESAYEAMMLHDLRERGLRVQSQVEMPLCYKRVQLDVGYRLDLLVGDLVIVGLKSVTQVTDVHKKQLLTYLKLADKRLGLLINFGGAKIKDGITRIAYKL